MALTSGRWIIAATLGCALVTATFAYRSEREYRLAARETPELLQYRRVQHRAVSLAQHWKAVSRRDSVMRVLAALDQRDSRAPRVIVDPRLPAAHRSLFERAVVRQWRNLAIDSARVPTTVVVVLDTARSRDLPNAARGEMTFDYALASTMGPDASNRCTAIVTIQAPQLATAGSHRRIVEILASGRESALLGPCAFQARFGVAGSGIDAWLRSRSYDLAARPSWQSGPSQAGVDSAVRSVLATSGDPAVVGQWRLSPDARGCVAGDTARCVTTLAAPTGSRNAIKPGQLVMLPTSNDQHWSMLGSRYLSDLVTALGPKRFGQFWRSELAPDAALRAVAATSLAVWTQRWAVGLIGPLRIGPTVSPGEMLAALLLAATCLAVTAWGWGRRQVR